MEERRKIVIPTGVDPEETLSRRYFDTEATLAARPVVPLSDAEAAQASASATKPARGRRWLLPAVIAAAVGVGVVAGLAISVYRYRQPTQAESPVAVRPIADKTRSTLSWTYTPEEPVTEEDATTDFADANEVTTPAPTETHPRAGDEADKKKSREEAARDERADRQDQIAQQREERAGDERAQRQEERRRRRAREDRNNNDELPQDPIMRHARDGVHRIREIFEGTP
ncbi:MAG TPA: hypothetical protein VGC91_03315 [Pyrinomonadaceae bacterium]|jgi:hypothetical protein